MYSHDVWGALALGVCVVGVAELLCWLLVYRTGSYVRQKDALDKANKKLEAMKATAVKGKKDKKQQQLEDRVKDLARDMNASKMRSGVVFALMMFMSYHITNRMYPGKIIAKLPFEAPGIMRRLTHNNIDGEDWTDCGATFIVVMSIQALRVTTQKLLGLTPRSLAKLNSFESYMNGQLEKQKLT